MKYKQHLIAQLLHLEDAAAVEEFIAAHRAALDLSILQELQTFSAQYKYDDPQRALEIAERAALVAQELDSVEGRAMARQAQADALVYLDRYPEARACYQEARDIYQHLGQELAAARMIGEVWTLAYLGYAREALRLADRLEPLLAASGAQGCEIDLRKLVGLWNNKGIAYDGLGLYEEALSNHARMAEQARTWDDELEAARAQHNRAWALVHLNELKEAETLLSQVRAVFARHEDWSDLARADLNLAVIYLHQERYSAALCTLETARATLHELEGMDNQLALLDLHQAQIMLRAGEERYAEIETILHRAQAVFAAHGPRSEEGEARLILGHCYLAQGKLAAARRSYQQLLALAPAVPPLVYQAHHGLGKTAAAEGKLDAARAAYDRAITQIERTRRTLAVDEFRASFIGDKLAVYRDMVLLCLQMGDKDAAFEYVERTRSRALLDMLTTALQDMSDMLDSAAPEVQELNRLQYELATLYRQLEVRQTDELRVLSDLSPAEEAQITALEDQIRSLSRDLERRYPRCDTLPTTQPARVSEIAAGLSPDTLLLEYHLAGEELWVFPVDSTGLQEPRMLGATAEILPTAQKWRMSLERVLSLQATVGAQYVHQRLAQLQTATRKSSTALYDMLLAPLTELLAAHSQLVIVPDGELHYLPFHALHDGTGYLLEQHLVSYAPSATVLRHCQQTQYARRDNMLVLGFSGGVLPHLQQEMDALQEIGLELTLYTESEATKQRLRERGSDYDVIHLAAHGRFRPYNPMFSYLSLADSDLLAREVYGLHLPAALVTLGACETGRGKRKGDDWWGLVRGFFSAGAAAVLATLWPVDDAATAHLMREFYRQLWAGASKTAALRAAQLTLLRQDDAVYCHPAYWAPFCLLGSGDAIWQTGKSTNQQIGK